MNSYEQKAFKQLIKNGKYFVPPEDTDEDLKTLLKRPVSAGAGRPVDDNGFPEGPWTAELLAEAISEIDANHSGIELRTVQHWLQDNDRGIRAENIRWLARVFGCDDPDATSDWQRELTAAQERLAVKRREKNKRPPEEPLTVDHVSPQQSPAPLQISEASFSLARRSEALFSRRSPLDLPASVFAGAVGLGFLAFFLGIHSIDYTRPGGVPKQVGFLWAPNWTFLFMIFMPLFFAFAVELMSYWKNEGRRSLIETQDLTEDEDGWDRKVMAASYTYWAVFILCVAFAGLFQWIGVRLMTLLNGVDDYAIDWGTLTLVRPETISVPQSIAFTGFAYLYMCLCFYMFFAGLILLFTVSHDFWEIEQSPNSKTKHTQHAMVAKISRRVMRAICRCTIAGIFVAICMKLQSFYLTSSSPNVVQWLADDALSVVAIEGHAERRSNFSMPTHYTSLIVALATCVPFLYGFMRLALGERFTVRAARMAGVVLFLLASYLLIGAFAGFSIMLGGAMALGLYCFFDPELRFTMFRRIEGQQNAT